MTKLEYFSHIITTCPLFNCLHTLEQLEVRCLRCLNHKKTKALYYSDYLH